MVMCISIEIERYQRYLDKIAFIQNRIKLAFQWINELSFKELLRDEKSKLAIYKAFQEAIEAMLDVIAMICKDLMIGARDDYTNINNLVAEAILELDHGRVLREANGLRNKLIHWYNKLDDEIAMRSIMRLIPQLESITRVVLEWLKSQLKR